MGEIRFYGVNKSFVFCINCLIHAFFSHIKKETDKFSAYQSLWIPFRYSALFQHIHRDFAIQLCCAEELSLFDKLIHRMRLIEAARADDNRRRTGFHKEALFARKRQTPEALPFAR